MTIVDTTEADAAKEAKAAKARATAAARAAKTKADAEARAAAQAKIVLREKLKRSAIARLKDAIDNSASMQFALIEAGRTVSPEHLNSLPKEDQQAILTRKANASSVIYDAIFGDEYDLIIKAVDDKKVELNKFIEEVQTVAFGPKA
jgi:thioesterase domain-containing protein